MSDWCSCNPLKEAQEKAAKWDAIVRCGECVFANYDNGGFFRSCSKHGINLAPRYGFCAWGKRIDR